MAGELPGSGLCEFALDILEGEEPPKSPPWGGIPTKTVHDFMKALERVRAWRSTRDIYFCLSLQAQTRLNSRGKVVAARSKGGVLVDLEGDLCSHRRKGAAERRPLLRMQLLP